MTDTVHSADLFERVMRSHVAGVALFGPEGTFLRVNPALCELLGRTEEELLAATWQDLTHPHDLETDLSLVREALDGRRDEYRLQKRFLRKDGAVVWADLSVSCLRDEQGRLECFIAQLLDTTPLVRAQQDLATSEEHYRLLVENSSDVVLIIGQDAKIQWVSANVHAVLGFRPENVIGRGVVETLIHPDHRERIREQLRIAIPEGRATKNVFPTLTADGDCLWVEGAGQPLLSDGDRLRRVVRFHNVDAEHRAQQQLRHSEELFRTAMVASPIGMATLDLERRFTRVNPALAELLGCDADHLVGRSLQDFLSGEDARADSEVRGRLHAGEDATTSLDQQLLLPDGGTIEVQHAIGLLCPDEGGPTGYVSQFIDMREVNRAREAMEFLAAHDPLTALPNRRGTLSRLNGLLSHPHRTGTWAAVLYADLDGFKPINDSYGHAAGDHVLAEIGRRLRAGVRSDDMVGRLGGDEFVVVLLGLHGSRDVARLANDLRRDAAAPIVFEEMSLTVTISVGLSLIREEDTVESVLARADRALYASKRSGGDCVTMA